MNQRRSLERIRLTEYQYLIVIFTLLLIFFWKIHPLFLFDTDDWFYICYDRPMYPVWGDWNPTRVFPEIFMPLCADIAGFLVYPWMGDFLESFTFVNAIVVSLFILLYLHMLFRLLVDKWKVPLYRSLVLTTIFFLLHFILFWTKDAGNDFLFNAPDTTCYYYYVIPSLLNCSLVLYLMRKDILYDPFMKLKLDGGGYRNSGSENIESDSGSVALRRGAHRAFYRNNPQCVAVAGFKILYNIIRVLIWLAAFYFALFSNLYQSAILAVFIIQQIVFDVCAALYHRDGLICSLKKNILRILFVAAWFVEQIFEVNGGRAHSKIEVSDGLIDGSIRTLRELLAKMRTVNHWLVFTACIVFLVLTVTALILRFYRHRTREVAKANPKEGKERMYAPVCVSGVLLLLYLVPVCALSNSISRSDIVFGPMFYLFMIFIISLQKLAVKIKFADAILTALLISYLGACPKPSFLTFSGSVEPGTVPIGIQIDLDIIDQMKTAYREARFDMELYVPVYGGSNHPVGTYHPERYSIALYRYKVLPAYMRVTVVPTNEKNVQFGIP